jgi:hypothetical protein
MEVCKQCGKEVLSNIKKRKKEFCNNTCRSNFWYTKNKKSVKIIPASITDEKRITPTTQTTNSAQLKINELTAELNSLGSGRLGQMRKNFLTNKINKLKEEL